MSEWSPSPRRVASAVVDGGISAKSLRVFGADPITAGTRFPLRSHLN